MNKFKKILAAAILTASLTAFSLSSALASDVADLSVLKARVSKIASKLEAITGLKTRILVTSDPSGNACVLPDKTVVITSGLVALCRSDDELAFVIAHEVSHIIAKDHYEEPTPALSGQKYVPDHELREINADKKAIVYTKKAGYNPDESVSLLTRITPASNVYFKSRLEALVGLLKTLKD